VRRHDARSGRPDALIVTVSAGLGAQLMRVASGVRRVFDLDADPATIGRALSTERSMAALVKARPGLRIPGAWHPWEIALRAIVGQQVSVQAATTIVGRIVARAGRPIATPYGALTRLFPDPAAVAAADLSSIGMPGKRTETVTRFAAGLAAGTIKLEITGTYEETVRSLCTIPGIGPWTAEYIALRALGEPDAFPAGDLDCARRSEMARPRASGTSPRCRKHGARGADTRRCTCGPLSRRRTED
jgi:DNA-3-methyladenine glycosylase II